MTIFKTLVFNFVYCGGFKFIPKHGVYSFPDVFDISRVIPKIINIVTLFLLP